MDGWMNGFVITLCLMASFVKPLLCKEGKKKSSITISFK